MSQPKKYRCQKGANSTGIVCIIDEKSRDCRFCRLKKCLSVGMSIECKFMIFKRIYQFKIIFFYFHKVSHIGRQTNIFKHQIIENMKIGVATRHKRPSSNLASNESSPVTVSDQVRKSKRAKLTSSDNSLDTSDSSSVSIPAQIDNIPLNDSPPNHSVLQNNYFDSYPQSTYQSVSAEFPNYYSAYAQPYNQMYSRNFFENFNYGLVGVNQYANANFFFPGNQFSAKYNTYQQPQGCLYVDSFANKNNAENSNFNSNYSI